MPKIYPHDYAKSLKKWEKSVIYRSTHQRGSLCWRQALKINQGSYNLKQPAGGPAAGSREVSCKVPSGLLVKSSRPGQHEPVPWGFAPHRTALLRSGAGYGAAEAFADGCSLR